MTASMKVSDICPGPVPFNQLAPVWIEPAADRLADEHATSPFGRTRSR